MTDWPLTDTEPVARLPAQLGRRPLGGQAGVEATGVRLPPAELDGGPRRGGRGPVGVAAGLQLTPAVEHQPGGEQRGPEA